MDLNRGWNPSFISESSHVGSWVTACVCVHDGQITINQVERTRTHTHTAQGAAFALSCVLCRVSSHVKTPWQEFSCDPSAIFSPSRLPSILVSSCTCLPSTSLQPFIPNLTKHGTFHTFDIRLHLETKVRKKSKCFFVFFACLPNERRCLGDTLRADDLGPSRFHVIIFFFLRTRQTPCSLLCFTCPTAGIYAFS